LFFTGFDRILHSQEVTFMAALAFGTATRINSITYDQGQQPIDENTAVRVAPANSVLNATFQNNQVVLSNGHDLQANAQVVVIPKAALRSGTAGAAGEVLIRPQAGGNLINAETRVLILSEPVNTEDSWTYWERLITKLVSFFAVTTGGGLLTCGILTGYHAELAWGVAFLAGGATGLIYYDMQYNPRLPQG
jgi:hypothetical protein